MLIAQLNSQVILYHKFVLSLHCAASRQDHPSARPGA